ncbi:hypothetical protein NBRC116494_01000 [Aurantivibrio plasticivorans]
MNLRFKRLDEVEPSALIALMNNPAVRRQMPLTFDNFDEDDCNTFVAAKNTLWRDHGYGPWGFYIDNEFAGWGGLQPEHGDADFALVLHPRFWGAGKSIFTAVVNQAFTELDLPSITVLIPPSRTRIHGLRRLGFERDGELVITHTTFYRFRLHRETWNSNNP